MYKLWNEKFSKKLVTQLLTYFRTNRFIEALRSLKVDGFKIYLIEKADAGSYMCIKNSKGRRQKHQSIIQ